MSPAVSLIDPVRFAKAWWPGVNFYDKQREIIHSVRDNDETFVPAGNMLGKDFVAGYVALSFFLRPQLYHARDYAAFVESQRGPTGEFPHTVRVITTSVKDDHLRVLWGEIGRYIQGVRLPLERDKGGLLVVNHRDIRKVVKGRMGENPQVPRLCPISYLRGMVSERGEGMAGHHAAYTLGIIDEASGVDDEVYTQMLTWARKLLVIGNPNPCPPTHFFFAGVKGGDVAAA